MSSHFRTVGTISAKRSKYLSGNEWQWDYGSSADTQFNVLLSMGIFLRRYCPHAMYAVCIFCSYGTTFSHSQHVWHPCTQLLVASAVRSGVETVLCVHHGTSWGSRAHRLPPQGQYAACLLAAVKQQQHLRHALPVCDGSREWWRWRGGHFWCACASCPWRCLHKAPLPTQHRPSGWRPCRCCTAYLWNVKDMSC